MRDYVAIAAPLIGLLKKGERIIWSEELQKSFDELKRIVTTAPCLKLPDFTKELKRSWMQAD